MIVNTYWSSCKVHTLLVGFWTESLRQGIL